MFLEKTAKGLGMKCIPMEKPLENFCLEKLMTFTSCTLSLIPKRFPRLFPHFSNGKNTFPRVCITNVNNCKQRE